MRITKKLMRNKETQEKMLKLNEEEAEYTIRQMYDSDTISRLRAAFVKKKSKI